jgi:hypothetical protein
MGKNCPVFSSEIKDFGVKKSRNTTWEADILPLNYARQTSYFVIL